MRCLATQTRLLTAKIASEKDALEALMPLARSISELLREGPRVRVADVVMLTGANRNTVKARLDPLRQQGLIVQRGLGRGAYYTKL